MKKNVQSVLLASLFIAAPLWAQLPTRELSNKIYNGTGLPDETFFTNVITRDSVTLNQSETGLNIQTKGSKFIPALWYFPAEKGFNASEALTVETRVAITKSEGNGCILEIQGKPGRRIEIAIDTTAVYNMTYYPVAGKELIAGDLDNRGMHTYRIAVDENDIAHIFRDNELLGKADVDGESSANLIYSVKSTLLNDSPIENLINYAVETSMIGGYEGEQGFLFDIANDCGITCSTWSKMGVDTLKANVKVGKTSLWFTNGTSGHLWFKKQVTASKYKFSFWVRTRQPFHFSNGSVTLINENLDRIPILPGTTSFIPKNSNVDFVFRQLVFDVPEDGTIEIRISNAPAGAACHMWFDDIRIEEVIPQPYVCVGKDRDPGIHDFTWGGFAYDLSGAYAPAGDAKITSNKADDSRLQVCTAENGETTVNYTLDQPTGVTLSIVDLNGQVVSETAIYGNSGQNSTTLNVPAKGIYLLRMTCAEQTLTTKFVSK